MSPYEPKETIHVKVERPEMTEGQKLVFYASIGLSFLCFLAIIFM